ncbi:MAG: oxygen-independent coproporphyrinogen III oxidase [Clostridia bacterium]|jgi:oxygen-independent coproporphyrinogen-3 oxidase|nr:oxygen-independent coproporphyrinogen III oxidase [Clostridia bacterium]
MELGIYIHIPFCVKKCDYCDFVSYSNKFDLQEEYVKKIIEEIEDNRILIEENNINTIYIGGGTPSSIKPELIRNILDKIYKIAKIESTENIEITIEVNPGTVTKNNLQMYKDCGINRLSIGLQSTNNQILKTIGRIHNYEQFLNTYNWATEVGFENINVDLMLGLPGQTISDLKESLNNIINLKPQHISVYSLIIEEGTEIEGKINKGILKLPDEEAERNQYRYVKDYLELNLYKHYEISNFAQKGYESKHNMNCWEQKQYIGIGLAAHSYINGCRYSNTNDMDLYLKNKSKDVKTIHEEQDIEDMKKEYMLLGLRKLEGVSISKFKKKFGENPIYLFRNELQRLVEENLIIIDLDNIRLTNKGLDLANLVWEEFV